MLTGDTNDQTAQSASDKGLVLDMSIILDSIVSDTGTIKVKETSVTKKVAGYEKELLVLQTISIIKPARITPMYRGLNNGRSFIF